MLPPALTEAFPALTVRRLLNITSAAASITAPVAAVTAAPIVTVFPVIRASACEFISPFILTSVSDMISALPVVAIEPLSFMFTVPASIVVLPVEVIAAFISALEPATIEVFPVEFISESTVIFLPASSAVSAPEVMLPLTSISVSDVMFDVPVVEVMLPFSAISTSPASIVVFAFEVSAEDIVAVPAAVRMVSVPEDTTSFMFILPPDVMFVPAAEVIVELIVVSPPEFIIVSAPEETAPFTSIAPFAASSCTSSVDVTVFPIVISFDEFKNTFLPLTVPCVEIEASAPEVVTCTSLFAVTVSSVRFLSALVSHILPLSAAVPFAEAETVPSALTLNWFPSAPIFPAVEDRFMFLPAVKTASSLFCRISF